MHERYDVIVVGGGTAGVVAAIQSARAGARTLLLEKCGMLGGTMTLGGIDKPAHFCAWGRQIIAGIGWELMCRTWEETGRPIPTPEYSRDTSTPPHLTVDRSIFPAICDDMVLAAGADLLFHAMPAAAEQTEDGWKLTVCTKTGLRQVRTRILVDSTGDANVVALAGLEIIRPETVQPATLSLQCSGYDPEDLDHEALKAASDKAIEAGELLTTDIAWHSSDGPGPFLKRFGRNANHLRAPRAETSEGRSAAEIEGRRAMLRMYRFLRRQPGLENLKLDWVCPEVGIRETAVIKGRTTLTIADYEAGKLFDDAVCYAFYPVDEHLNDGRGIHHRLLAHHVLPTIPRGAMLPQGSRFLVVAGRCIASDREANSAIRVEAPCMAMGQAAGAMGALSARSGHDPETIPMQQLHALLREHGAVIPGDIEL